MKNYLRYHPQPEIGQWWAIRKPATLCQLLSVGEHSNHDYQFRDLKNGTWYFTSTEALDYLQYSGLYKISIYGRGIENECALGEARITYEGVIFFVQNRTQTEKELQIQIVSPVPLSADVVESSLKFGSNITPLHPEKTTLWDKLGENHANRSDP